MLKNKKKKKDKKERKNKSKGERFCEGTLVDSEGGDRSCVVDEILSSTQA